MRNRNLVVSGSRLAEHFQAASATREARSDRDAARDLAALVGASDDDFHVSDRIATESTSRSPSIPLTDLELESLMMRLEAAVQLLDDVDETPGVFATTENRYAALIQSALAERAAKENRVGPAAARSREAKFDEHDIRWALSLLTWIGQLKPHDWKPLPQQPESCEGDLRFALMGDWGTGLYGAPQCAASIAEMGGFDYVVHLGDVYYSGTKNEIRSNFLRTWPRVAGSRSRACNGNHEMYSGGYGYFDLVLPHFEQSSSCFAVQNRDWLIVGLDSAYDDHDLANHQNAWLKRLVDAASDRKLVVFTHHQPFSHFDGGGEKLVEKLLPLLRAQRIAAWYWGHEHRCVIYDRHPRWKFFGRCIGHSGYPYFRKPSLPFRRLTDPPPISHSFWRELPFNRQTNTPHAILLDGPNPDLGRQAAKYGPHGYVTLEFEGPTLTERYFLANGEQLTTKRIA
jgi:hypothetical protein